jgi:hypothetical protein
MDQARSGQQRRKIVQIRSIQNLTKLQRDMVQRVPANGHGDGAGHFDADVLNKSASILLFRDILARYLFHLLGGQLVKAIG